MSIAQATPSDRIRPILWQGQSLLLLDQRRLPFEEVYLSCQTSSEVAAAIRALVVRGAPAIGIAAAWAVVLAAAPIQADHGPQALIALEPALSELIGARPTAVTLQWAIQTMRQVLAQAGADWRTLLCQRAQAMMAADLTANRRIGTLGAALLPIGCGVLTHCNTGSLATAGFGTALGVIRVGVAQGKIARLYAGETRPWLQGSRLTVWELQRDGIDVTLIADAAAAYLMQLGRIDWVIIGADRICANGDVANKIGSYALAILARYHGVKVMVAAAAATVDLCTADGAAIAIEQRDGRELVHLGAQAIAPENTATWNPVFDITPAPLIDALVTECGVITQPNTDALRTRFGRL